MGIRSFFLYGHIIAPLKTERKPPWGLKFFIMQNEGIFFGNENMIHSLFFKNIKLPFIYEIVGADAHIRPKIFLTSMEKKLIQFTSHN